MIEKYERIKTEDEHGLHGLGEIGMNYNSEPIRKFTFFSPVIGEIEFTGDIAENLADKNFRSKSTADLLLKIKYIAAECCETTLIQMNRKTNHEKCVQARGLVYWYAKTKIDKYTFATAGAIFGYDHATAFSAIKYINSDDSFKKPLHREYHNAFFAALKERGL